MNIYRLSFFLRMSDGSLRGATHQVAAPCATQAILIVETMPWPGTIVGPLTWSLVGPSLPRIPVPLAA